MGKPLFGIFGAIIFVTACTYEPPITMGTAGAGGNGAATSGSTGGQGTGGDGVGGQNTGGNGLGGQAGAGGGASDDLQCVPLPQPTNNIIPVTPAEAPMLPNIVAQAPSNSTIVLKAGNYFLTDSLRFEKDNVTLRSETNNPKEVVLDGGYKIGELLRIKASNVTIAHVTITRSIDHGIHIYPQTAGVNVTGTLLYGLRIVDHRQQFIKMNPITGQEGYVDEGRIECSEFLLTNFGRAEVPPCATGGIDVHTGMNWIIRGNVFRGIYCDTGLAKPAVFFWVGSRGTLVENNLIMNCAQGIGFGHSSGNSTRVYPDAPHGDNSLDHYDGIIRNNVIFGNNPRFDTGIQIEDAKVPQIIHNTIIRGANATSFYSSIDYRYATTSVIIKNNLTSGISAREGASGTVETNLTDTPLNYFINPSMGDFHLTAAATPAVNSGVTVVDATGTDISGVDIDGQPHTLGGSPDMGADEVTP